MSISGDNLTVSIGGGKLSVHKKWQSHSISDGNLSRDKTFQGRSYNSQ